jgi:hypothetical protein
VDKLGSIESISAKMAGGLAFGRYVMNRKTIQQMIRVRDNFFASLVLFI